MIHRVAALSLLVTSLAQAQEVVKPYVMLSIDTSGSMAWDVCASGGIIFATEFDDSAECAGTDTTCADCNTVGCDNGIPDDSRLWKVKKGMSQVINSFGEVTYSLARYHANPTAFGCLGGSWAGDCASNGGFGGGDGDILVPFADGNERDLLEWMDYCDNWPTTNDCDPVTNLAPATGCALCPNCGGGCDKELRPTGATPIAGSLASVEQYLGQVKVSDPKQACRPYVAIALTDGEETCDNQAAAVAAAAAICNNLGIPVYVVGFADPSLQTNLDAIADAGCNSACNARGCRDNAIVVDNETDLALAFADIIQGSVLFEKCNGLDDDCDDLIDEDFPGLGDACCNPCNGQIVCNAAGDGTICNGFGPCMEICNARDDDCDGLVDEDIVPMCAYEVCNGMDDDGDGLTDELPLPGLGEECGTDEGECDIGVTCCAGGAFSCCGADPPTPEICDCEDDNCNGLTDEAGSRRCYDGPVAECPDPLSGSCNGICQPGVQPCVTTGCPGSPGFGACLGEVGPRVEACNCLDDNCNGVVDDNAICPNGAPCTDCGCPQGCNPLDEFPCPAGFFCSGNCEGSPEPYVCLPDPCLGVICDLGETCEACNGACDDPCIGIDCGEGRTCCAGFCCEGWQTCQDLDNDAVATCDDTSCSNPAFPCAAGEVCKNHECVGDPCADTDCGASEYCLDGKCFPVCPRCRSDEHCVAGICVIDPCANAECVGANVICCGGTCQNDPCAASDECDPGQYCDGCSATCPEDACLRIQCPQGYACQRGQCEPPANLEDNVTDLAASGSGGCSCDLAASSVSLSSWWAIGALLLLARGLRRTPPRRRRAALLIAPLLGLLGGCDVQTLRFEVAPGDAGTVDMGMEDTLCMGRGAIPEICNGVDDDCNGQTDDGNPGGGGPCGLGCTGEEEAGDMCPQKGVCTHGVKTCMLGMVVCVGDVKPSAEVCNGLDDSCDEATDEVFDFCNSSADCGGCGSADTAFTCPADCPSNCGDGACTATEKIAGICLSDCPDTCGDGTCSAALTETACSCRADCPAVCGDGCCSTSEDSTECPVDCPTSCGDGVCPGIIGTAGNCSNIPQATGLCDSTGCAAGACPGCATCQIQDCKPGWVDCENDVPINDCNCPCSTMPGPEVCDNVDNDCNGVTDDGVVTLNFCRQLGACGGSSPICLGAMGFCCNYGPDVEIEPDTNLCGFKVVDDEADCNDIDGDCDGGTDEMYTDKNQPCSDSGVGACQGKGTYECTLGMDATECVLTSPGLPANHESCDGVDNDCDGPVDENTDGPSQPSCGGTCLGVNDALTAIGTLRIYTYEASRPGSTAMAQAPNTNRACSKDNVLPWSSITWQGAADACAAAGMRLCSGTEWQTACEGAANTTWPFGDAASDAVDDDGDFTNSDLDQCNGKEYDVAAGVDALLPTGSLANCDSQEGAFDLSGNLQEWTSEPPMTGSGYVVRGGAFDDTNVGLECDNKFTVLPTSWTYPNTGFRCCCTQPGDCPP